MYISSPHASLFTKNRLHDSHQTHNIKPYSYLTHSLFLSFNFGLRTSEEGYTKQSQYRFVGIAFFFSSYHRPQSVIRQNRV